MLRNRLILFVTIVILVHVPSAIAEELTPAKEADIKKLFELTGARQIGFQMAQFMEQMAVQQIKSVRPDIPARYLEILHEESDRLMRVKMDEPGGLTDLLVRIYSNYYTHKEIKGLLEFYQTELGKKTIRVMPQLLNDSMIAGQQWAQRNVPILYESVRRRCKEEGIELPKLPQGDQSAAKQIYIGGVDYAAQGQFSEAKEEFEKALKVDPSYGSAKRTLEVFEDVSDGKIERKAAIHLFKGLACALKGQWDEAIGEYDKAIEINPYVKAYTGRGAVYAKKGQYDRAISDHTQAIEMNARYAKAYYNRAIACYYKGEYDKAWDDVYKAQSLGYQAHPGFLKALREASGRQI